jgi:hypothetical protein
VRTACPSEERFVPPIVTVLLELVLFLITGSNVDRGIVNRYNLFDRSRAHGPYGGLGTASASHLHSDVTRGEMSFGTQGRINHDGL